MLLILSALDDATFRRLLDYARALDLDALCEVHDEEELKRAIDGGADIIGVNSRNLRTFQVSLDTLMDMAAMATPADRPPTSQTAAVSREVMAKVDSEVEKFEKLVAGDIAKLNTQLAKARIKHLTAA